MNHKKGFLPVVVGVVLALLVIVGSIYAIRMHNSAFPSEIISEENPIETVTSASPISSSPSAFVSVAGWKTYRNREYAFEFQYSPLYSVGELDPATHGNEDIVQITPVAESEEFYDVAVQITMKKLPPDFVSLDSIVSKESVESLKKIQFAGQNALRVDYKANSGGGGGEVPPGYRSTIVFTKDDNLYEILLANWVGDTKRAVDIETMISTFAFIPKSPAWINDWKTYRNEEYGFEFQYPPTTDPLNFFVEPTVQIANGGNVPGVDVSLLPDASGPSKNKFAKQFELRASRSSQVMKIDATWGKVERKTINGITFIMEPWLDYGGRHESQGRSIETSKNGVYYHIKEFVSSVCIDVTPSYDCPEGHTSETEFAKQKDVFDKILSTFEFISPKK